MRLEGKTALITGAASGLGASAVARFVAEGCQVCLCDIQEEEGKALAAELGDQVFLLILLYKCESFSKQN